MTYPQGHYAPGPGHQPTGRPRPGAAPMPQGAPSFQSNPHYVDYGNPRAYDTSVRPATGLTRARHAPAQISRPNTAQPQSAWATQTRRIQQVADEKALVPFTKMAMWIVLILLGMALVLVLGYFFLDYIIGSSSNPIWWPISAFLAFFSLLVIFCTALLADRWDPQPIGLLIVAVLWGAAIATFVSYWVNTLGSMVVYMLFGEAAANFYGPVISAPIVEEVTKGLGLLLLLFLARRYFNGPLDGLIYGMLAGGGFAFTENIIYYTRTYDDAGVGGLIFIVVIRGVLNIFGHAIYTGLTGVVMGFVARKWGTIPGALSFVVALIPGMLLHAAWNFTAGLGGGLIVLLLMFGGQALITLIFIFAILVLLWDEARLTRVRLGDYANHGWLTHEEVNMLATWRGRREGKRWAASFGAKRLMKRFIREAADLASVRQRLLADGQDPKAVKHEAALLNQLTRNRHELLQAAR